MSIFRKLKPQKIVDTVFSGVDKAVLTKEEIVDYTMKAVTNNLEFVKATQSESTPRAITRRIIAIMIIGQFILAFNIGVIGICSGWYDGEKILSLSIDAFEWATISVVVFYFGNHMLNTIIPKFTNKK